MIELSSQFNRIIARVETGFPSLDVAHKAVNLGIGGIENNRDISPQSKSELPLLPPYPTPSRAAGSSFPDVTKGGIPTNTRDYKSKVNFLN